MTQQALERQPPSVAPEMGGGVQADLPPSIEKRNRGPEWEATRLMVESMLPLFRNGADRAVFLVGFRCGMRRALDIIGGKP